MFNLASACCIMLSLASIGLVWLPLAFNGRLCAALLPPCCPLVAPHEKLYVWLSINCQRFFCMLLPPWCGLVAVLLPCWCLLLRSWCGLVALLLPSRCPFVAVLVPPRCGLLVGLLP